MFEIENETFDEFSLDSITVRGWIVFAIAVSSVVLFMFNLILPPPPDNSICVTSYQADLLINNLHKARTANESSRAWTTIRAFHGNYKSLDPNNNDLTIQWECVK